MNAPSVARELSTMSSQSPSYAQHRYRYYMKGIQVESTEHVKNVVWARLLVDGEVVHKLTPIKKGQPLAWDVLLYCDAGKDSIMNFQLYEAAFFGLKPTLKCSIKLLVSEISDKSPTHLIKRTSDSQLFSFTFLNPPSVLHPETMLTALKSILNFGVAVSELWPTDVETTLSACHTACQMLGKGIEYSKDIEDLVVGFAHILRPIHSVNKNVCSTDIKETVRSILHLIQKVTKLIIGHRSMTETERLDLAIVQESRGRVQDFLEELRKLKKDFDRQLDQPAYLDWINKMLGKLKPVARSTYHGNHECLPGTRTTIISNINEWIDQKGGTDRLMWIHGTSGIGKSTLAASICRSLEAKNMLCVSFFCKWDDYELREPELVIRSIVHSLARCHVDYRKLAASMSHDGPEPYVLSFPMLYEHLVATTLIGGAYQEATLEHTCIVVDALDQCGTNDTRRSLLSYLFELSERNPWMKVIVTACPEQDILEFFDNVHEGSLKRIDICKYDASNDISAFIRVRLPSPQMDQLELDDSHVSSLTDSARGLFIWADIACKHILDGPDPHGCLEDILQVRSSDTTGSCSQLDLLYSKLLRKAAFDITEDYGPKRWLGVIVASGFCTPLSVASLEQLLRKYMSPVPLAIMLNALHPILYEDRSSDRHGVVRVYHRSFIDYITTRSRSRNLFVDVAESHARLSNYCLGTMLSELRFNICQLETSYLLNRDVPNLEPRVRSAIGPHLSYSCLWWISHVTMAGSSFDNGPVALLNDFIFGRALFYWVEALSLMNKLEVAISQLPKLVAWSSLRPDLAELLEYASDACKFIACFYDVISESTPHLYLSALTFAPTNSPTAQQGRKWFPNIPKLIQGASRSWQPFLRVVSISNLAICVSPSPDGHTIVTGWRDHTVRLWDMETTTRVFARLIGHSDCVWSVAFSPNRHYVASGSHDKTVRVWDARTGDKVLEPLVGHSGPVLSVTFSHDSGCIASGSHDKTVRIWNTKTGADACTPLVGHSGPVLAVAFSPKDHCIASGSCDKTVRIWDTKTRVSNLLTAHSGWVQTVAFSPDGRCIASGSSDRTIRIWGVEASTQVYAPLIGHSGAINAVAFSPDGLRIISSSSDETVRMWDLGAGIEVLVTPVGRLNCVIGVGDCTQGGWVVSPTRNHTIRTWNARTIAEGALRAPPTGKSGPRLLASATPKDCSIWSGFDARPMQIQDSAPVTTVSVRLIGHSGRVSSVAFSPDGRRILVGSDHKTVRMWNAETGAPMPVSLVGHFGTVWSASFSPDGRCVVSASEDRTVRIWDAETGTQIGQPLFHFPSVCSVSFSPDGRHVASGSFDRTVRIWDTETARQVFAPLCGHTDIVFSVSFSPDGRRIVSGSFDMTLRMWDAGTGRQVSAPFIGHTDYVRSVAFSPDGQCIVSGSDDRTVRIWSVETGTQVLAPLVGHSDWVRSVAFSPNGRLVVSGSSDRSVRLWDAETGTQVCEPLVGHSGPVLSISFSPDGRKIVSSSANATVRIWNVPHNLTKCEYPGKMSHFWRFMQPTGWISPKDRPNLLWIPSELRTPATNTPSTSAPFLLVPPGVSIDFSRFVHGYEWTSVASV